VSAPRRRPAAAGFTLLETLVALAILGIVLTTVFGVIGSGLRAAHRDEDRLLLGLVAQNLLVRSRLDLTTADGPRSGDIGGGLRWRIESDPYTPPEDILPPPPDPDANRGLPTGNRESGLEAGAGPDQPADAEPSSFGRDRESQRETTSGRDGGSLGDRGGAGETATGFGRRDREEKVGVRLRLVRVTVEKGGQQFQLTGLAAEPRRERAGAL